MRTEEPHTVAVVVAGGVSAPRGGARPWLLHVLLPLAGGGLLYALWRTPRPVLLAWLGDAGLGGALARLRSAGEPLRGALTQWLVAHLPDGLWAYAVTSQVALLWRGGPARARWTWLAVTLALALLLEGSQYPRLVPGTFDPLDLLCLIGGWTAALLATRRGREEEPT